MLMTLFFVTFATKASAATTNNWTNSVSGLWQTGSNWSSNQPPNSTFTYILITNSSTKTVTIDASTPSTNLTIQRLIVSAPAGSTNTLALVNVTTNLPLQLSSTLTVDSGCVLSLTNSALISAGVIVDHGGALNITNSLLSESGFTTFDIVNGSAWLENGLLDCSAIQAVRLGRTNASSGAGILTVNGGTLLAYQMQIGSSTGSSATLALNRGMVSIITNQFIGFGSFATGVVAVAGGQLLATNGVTYIGGNINRGFGQLNLSSGNASFAFLQVGPNGDGQVSVSGGQLTVRPRATNDLTQIGYLGNGELDVSGGTVTLLTAFHIGDDFPFRAASGAVSITGGQLMATNDLTAIGRWSPGQMTISNATAWLTNVSVGRHDGGVGALTIQSNAQVFLLDALSIGRFSNSVGHVLMTGGRLSISDDNLWIGREGMGDMTLSNGTVQAVSAFVAVSTVVTDTVTLLPVTNIPSGTLTVVGGSLILTSNFLVGASSLSTGQVFMVGGNLTVANGGSSGYLAVSSGAFTLNQGSVTTDNLCLTNNSGQFIFNGGLLQAKSMTVSNGLPFVVGDGVDSATLQLQGGTFVFANGLVVSSNATVTGCGTIIGPITNNGGITTNCPPVIHITSIRKAGPTVTLTFTTATGSNHVVEYKNSLLATNWTVLLPGLVGTGMVMTNTDTNAIAPSRFYRIHAQ
jgi:T5SS/PEP-CTERM-associated repeat protein